MDGDYKGCYVSSKYGLLKCENAFCNAPVVVYGSGRMKTWQFGNPVEVWYLDLVCPECWSAKVAFWQKDFEFVEAPADKRGKVLPWLGIEDPFSPSVEETKAQLREVLRR